MHLDRLARNIFYCDLLLRNDNGSLEIRNVFKLMNIDNIFLQPECL